MIRLEHAVLQVDRVTGTVGFEIEVSEQLPQDGDDHREHKHEHGEHPRYAFLGAREEGYDGIDILNALIDKIANEEIKEYKEIEIEEPYKRSKKEHNRKDKFGKTISYSYYQINLGKNDGVKPKEFVELMEQVRNARADV